MYVGRDAVFAVHVCMGMMFDVHCMSAWYDVCVAGHFVPPTTGPEVVSELTNVQHLFSQPSTSCGVSACVCVCVCVCACVCV